MFKFIKNFRNKYFPSETTLYNDGREIATFIFDNYSEKDAIDAIYCRSRDYGNSFDRGIIDVINERIQK